MHRGYELLRSESLFHYFLLEIRKRNGDKYPPRTQEELVAGIQHYFNITVWIEISSIFVDKEFKQTREILNRR